MDYQSKSQNASSESNEPPEKLEKVIVGQAQIPKKTLGQKFKETFLDVGFIKNVAKNAYSTVLVPNARNLAFDVGREILGGMIYKSGNPSRFLDPQSLVSRFTTYNMPVNYQQGGLPQNLGGMIPTQALPQANVPRRAQGPQTESILIPTEVEAELVMERMNEHVEKHNFVTVGNLLELAGMATTPTDFNWGWVYLGDAKITHTRDGYMMTFSKSQPLSSFS